MFSNSMFAVIDGYVESGLWNFHSIKLLNIFNLSWLTAIENNDAIVHVHPQLENWGHKRDSEESALSHEYALIGGEIVIHNIEWLGILQAGENKCECVCVNNKKSCCIAYHRGHDSHKN